VHYRIRVRGHLDAAWFDGLTVTHEADGDTTLTGPVVDQAALYGLIGRARDLGLTLVSVRCASDRAGDDATPHDGAGRARDHGGDGWRRGLGRS
jgi:hypothetical protein